MLNLVLKRVHPFIITHLKCMSSTFHNQLQGFAQLNTNEQPQSQIQFNYHYASNLSANQFNSLTNNRSLRLAFKEKDYFNNKFTNMNKQMSNLNPFTYQGHQVEQNDTSLFNFKENSILNEQSFRSYQPFTENRRIKSFQQLFSPDFQQGLEEKTSKLEKNQNLQFINSLDNKQNKKQKLMKLKLIVKKQTPFKQLKISQQNLQKVQKMIFGNKKILKQNILFKRFNPKTNQKFNKFGQNWVYAYDLPYQFSAQDAKNIIGTLSKRYGQIVEYSFDSYENFIIKSELSPIFKIPDDFNHAQQNKRNRFKAQRQEYEMLLTQNGSNDNRKQLTQRILQKMKWQRDNKLNKSTMLFKFKNKQDKNNFLLPEMRLYGLNFGKAKNIRFEQAQSKNIVALNMVPCGCQSSQLIRFINQALSGLKIFITHPNCIIGQGYVFIEMSNFYEAVHAKDVLNNFVFQKQRMKAQLCYGSSHLHEGKYTFNFSHDHYEDLVQKLSDLRNYYFKLRQSQ